MLIEKVFKYFFYQISEETPVKQMEQQMSELDNKLEGLEGENDQLKSEKSEMVAKMRVCALLIAWFILMFA